ncbi:MAG: NAD(+) kinase, partial [Deltaproteobacteria bacterium]|nr:NAD(+) kinase [Deltaproteobacteria bacterium]
MKKIGLVVKSDVKANEKAYELEDWLRSKKIEIVRKKTVESGQKNDS